MRTTLFAALVVVLAATLPGVAQELRAPGQIRSSGPVTSEASRKIVLRLRALWFKFVENMAAPQDSDRHRQRLVSGRI